MIFCAIFSANEFSKKKCGIQYFLRIYVKEYFMKALVIKNKLGDKYGANDIRNNLAIINNIQKNYPQAIAYGLESYTAANEMQNLELIKQSAKTLSYSYEKMKNTTDALKYFKVLTNKLRFP